MTELLDKLTRINATVKSKEGLARKIKLLNKAEMFDPRLTRIYYSELSELPDGVKNHPEAAQRVYLVTFNNILKKTGDQSKAMRGAMKALRNKISHINDMKRRANNRGGVDEGLIRWSTKRLIHGPQVQIVVP